MNEVEVQKITKLTSEILIYKQQTAQNIIEIGKRLIEAKEMLPHGEWLPWLQEKVEFTERTAQRFMKAANEFSNTTSMSYLGTTKVFALLDLPEDQRQDFIESNPVEDMTTRELKAAIAEKKRLEKELEDLKNKEPEIIERVIEKPTTPADYFSSKRRLAEMEAKTKELEEQIKHVEEQKKLYERKANLYESDANKYEVIKRDIESLTKERNSIRGEFLMMKEVAGLSTKIENFISTHLAPIKFAPYMSLVKKEPVVMKNVAETIGAVQRWVDEMNEMLPDYDVVMNIMESDYEVIHDEQ